MSVFKMVPRHTPPSLKRLNNLIVSKTKKEETEKRAGAIIPLGVSVHGGVSRVS